MAPWLEFTLEQGNITAVEADVVVLKHAQEFYGADKAVAEALAGAGLTLEQLSCAQGRHRLVESGGTLAARQALFLGVTRLRQFSYQQIRIFAADALKILAREAPQTRRVAMTLHGISYGLDEIESCLSLMAGCLDTLASGEQPSMLQQVVIVEKNRWRVERLKLALEQLQPQAQGMTRTPTGWRVELGAAQPGPSPMPTSGAITVQPSASPAVVQPPASPPTALDLAGARAEIKPHIFVAMPFHASFEDVFYYGIQKPIRDAGYLCERIDQSSFSGDIFDAIKQKIETAALVVADLSDANPNVYLEVGYAWGKGRPTILLVNNVGSLCFDVRGQRCLVYTSIRLLEQALQRELEQRLDTAG